MGCFSSTCKITRTHIGPGDPVFVVFYKPTYASIGGIRPFNTHDVLMVSGPKRVYSLERGLSTEDFLSLSVEEYDDYGCVPDDVDEEYRKHRQYWWDYQFICHKSVAENLLGRELKDDDKVQLEKDFFDLVHMCFMARIEIYGNIIGSQCLDTEELVLQNKVLHEVQRMSKIKNEQNMEMVIENILYRTDSDYCDMNSLPEDINSLEYCILYVIEVYNVHTFSDVLNKIFELKMNNSNERAAIVRKIHTLIESGLLNLHAGKVYLNEK